MNGFEVARLSKLLQSGASIFYFFFNFCVRYHWSLKLHSALCLYLDHGPLFPRSLPLGRPRTEAGQRWRFALPSPISFLPSFSRGERWLDHLQVLQLSDKKYAQDVIIPVREASPSESESVPRGSSQRLWAVRDTAAATGCLVCERLAAELWKEGSPSKETSILYADGGLQNGAHTGVSAAPTPKVLVAF